MKGGLLGDFGAPLGDSEGRLGYSTDPLRLWCLLRLKMILKGDAIWHLGDT